MTQGQPIYKYFYIHGKNQDGLRIYGYTTNKLQDILQKHKEEIQNPTTIIQAFCRREGENLQIKALHETTEEPLNPTQFLMKLRDDQHHPENHILPTEQWQEIMEKGKLKRGSIDEELQEYYDRIDYIDYYYDRYITSSTQSGDTRTDEINLPALDIVGNSNIPDYKDIKQLQEDLQTLINVEPKKFYLLNNMFKRTAEADEFYSKCKDVDYKDKNNIKTKGYKQLNNLINVNLESMNMTPFIKD